MARVSAKGVVIGGVLGVGATYTLSIPLMGIILLRMRLTALPEAQGDAAMMQALRPGGPYFVVGLLMGSASGILGGYVAARIPKHDECLNGAMSAWLAMVLGMYGWATGSVAGSTVEHIGYLVLSPVAGALGGFLERGLRSAR